MSCSKLAAAGQLTAALLTPDAPIVLPSLVRAHYVQSLVDWALGAVSRGKQSAKGAAAARPAQEPRLHADLWAALVTILGSDEIAETHPLPTSLLLSVPRVLQELSEKGASAGPSAKQRGELLTAVADLLHLLRRKFGGAYKPSLEHAAGLVEAALVGAAGAARAAAAEWASVATAALSFVLPALQQHPNQRKVWDTIVPRLLEPLIASGFPADDEESGLEEREGGSLAAACRAVLDAALFSPVHITGELSCGCFIHGLVFCGLGC